MVARFSRLAFPALLIVTPIAAAIAPALAQDAPASEVTPADDGCAGVIARWQDFAGEENRGGHMDTSVFDQIRNEIERADRLCQAGQDAQARRLVAESKHKHGYPP